MDPEGKLIHNIASPWQKPRIEGTQKLQTEILMMALFLMLHKLLTPVVAIRGVKETECAPLPLPQPILTYLKL